MLAPGSSLLKNRYQLVRRVSADALQQCEVWDALANPGRNDEYRCLIRAWPFGEAQPPPFLFTLWSRELRHQLRLASLAGADQSLVVLRDAGVDDEVRCFVTVHRASGQNPAPLDYLLTRRQQLSWLREWKAAPARARLWRGLLNIAQGLTLLHSQQMLHRALGERSIMADPDEGPTSFRLSGFEWTVRLGERNAEALPLRPADLDSGGFSAATDWFLYGVFCTRLLIGPPPGSPERPLHALLERLRSEKDLFDLERNLLERLIDANPMSRISRSEHIRHEILTIVERLERPLKQRGTDHFALIVDLRPDSDLTRKLRDLQEQEALQEKIDRQREQRALGLKETTPEPESPVPGLAAQLEWIERDLEGATLVRSVGTDDCTLRGRQLRYRVSEYTPPGTERLGTWELAYSGQTWDVRAAGYEEDLEVDLPVPVRVLTHQNVRRDRTRIVEQARSWKPLVSRRIEVVQQSASERRFVDFLRMTNQIEALMSDAQIFGYITLHQQKEETEKMEYLIIEERPRRSQPLQWALRVKKSQTGAPVSSLGTMIEDLRNEEARSQPDNPRPRLQLTESDHLRLIEKVTEPELWDVLSAEELPQSCLSKIAELAPQQAETSRLYLRRLSASALPEPPLKGFLRPADHWRQTLLLARRQKAIEALPQHAYLLRALLWPDLAYIDTQSTRLPLSLDQGIKESEKLDDAKRGALHNIWRTRPIFTLQGPPGTGKTTLVTALLRQVFAEDRNAQVLVTAQAHAALDTLRERVKRAYRDVPQDQHPLMIRLKIKGGGDRPNSDDDYPEQVAKRLLDRTHERLIKIAQQQPQLEKVQTKWLTLVKTLRNIDAGGITEPDAGPFLELLRRAANITYCTSTAGDLSVLATRTQSFDWCIVEEAAKAHGFDLVLPLQLAYRWLLIGDHYQLKPHRYRDFQDALAGLPGVMRWLKTLMEGGSRLIDRDLVMRWMQDEPEDGGLSDEQQKLHLTCTNWLRFFEKLFNACDAVRSGESERAAEEMPPIAWMLNEQHRMHPVIADLVSKAFYESQQPSRRITSRTGTADNPALRIRHAFVSPHGIADKSLVWVNVPWLPNQKARVRDEEGFWASSREAEAVERFLFALKVDPALENRLYENEENAEELKKLKLAVLSPYRKQVFSEKLRTAVSSIYSQMPPWLRTYSGASEFAQKRPRTVDSYQGNEAALVIVSLVRNNHEEDAAYALGFLQELDRMNVMFSRAERLLCLVGCWEFFASVADRLKQERSLQEWPLVVDYIEAAFASGKAVKFELSDLPALPHRRG